MDERRTSLLAVYLLLQQLFITLVFSAAVSKSICSDVMERHDKKGNISSPNYPLDYPPKVVCKWHIYHEADELITISFNTMDIADDMSKGCLSDGLDITDKQTRHYCGKDIPNPYFSILSTNDRLTISFRSDGADSGRGFRFMYYIGLEVSESCDPGTEFHCNNRRCIPREWLCNSFDECGDNSDEANENCKVECPPHTMYCLGKDGAQCLPEVRKCDGIPDCANGEDEKDCEVQCQHDLRQPSGSFTSPNYPEEYPDNLDCAWTIDVGLGNIVQLRFSAFELEQGYLTDYVKVYDGTMADSSLLISTYYGYTSNNPSTSTHYPPAVIQGTGSSLHVTFSSDASSANVGFNATYQTKGQCIDKQQPCYDSGNSKDCYAKNQQCDGEFTCLRGEDELGCKPCKSTEFLCDSGPAVKCYPQNERCNGNADCPGKQDEMMCTTFLCNASIGCFLCGTGRCIQELYWCDSNSDCNDQSDETNCPMSPKVITAAVVGSIVCGLLLVAALSCTCKLYQLYHSDPHLPTHSSPLSEIEDELMRREAPPSYTATMASPHFDDAQRAFIESLQAAANARHDGRGRSSRSSGSSARGRNQPQQQQNRQAVPSTNEGAADSSQNASDPRRSTTIAASQASDASQENETSTTLSELSNTDDNASPYAEMEEVPQPNQAGDTASSYTTDTDSDTNAEAEIEERNRQIIRAATNIRRMRLVGGVQTIVDSVTNRQRDDQRNTSEDESRRRSSSGLQNIIERISRSREGQNRPDVQEGEDDGVIGGEESSNESPVAPEAAGPSAVEKEGDGEGSPLQDSSSPHTASSQIPEASGSSAVKDNDITEACSSENEPSATPFSKPGGSNSVDVDDAPLDLSYSNNDHDSTVIDDDDQPLIIS